jgi:hypothetical protein
MNQSKPLELEPVGGLVSPEAKNELSRVAEAEDVEPDAILDVLLLEYSDHVLFNDSLNRAVHEVSYDVAD